MKVQMWACLLSFLLVVQSRRVFTPPAKKTTGTNSALLAWRNTQILTKTKNQRGGRKEKRRRKEKKKHQCLFLLPLNSAGVEPFTSLCHWLTWEVGWGFALCCSLHAAAAARVVGTGINLDLVGGSSGGQNVFGLFLWIFFFIIISILFVEFHYAAAAENGHVKLTLHCLQQNSSQRKHETQMMFNISIDGSSFSKNLEDFDSIRSVLLYRSVKTKIAYLNIALLFLFCSSFLL